jgi:hypothetical protein
MRLATEFWIKALMKRLELVHIPIYVLHHGDDTAGAVVVKVPLGMQEWALYHRSFDLMSGAQTWAELAKAPEQDIDDLISRQRKSDPDLWVIELENRDGLDYVRDMDSE